MFYSYASYYISHLMFPNVEKNMFTMALRPLFEKASSLLTRVKTFGWRRRACSPATQPKPWWRRPSATCRSPSASTSEPPSWRLTSGPRSEFSGRVRLLDKLEWDRGGLTKQWHAVNLFPKLMLGRGRSLQARHEEGLRVPSPRCITCHGSPAREKAQNICSSKKEIKPSLHLFIVS